MEQDFITIESAAFKAIMNKLDRIEKFILEVHEENKKHRAGPAKLLTGKEAADILRVSKQTLWRMRDRGDIQYIKKGNVCLYAPKELENVLATKVIRRRKCLPGNMAYKPIL